MLSVATCTCECVCVRVRLRHTPGYSLLWFYLERETHTQGVDMALGSTDRSCIPAKVNTHTHTKKGVKPLPFQLAASLGLWLNSFWGFHLSEQAEAQRQQYRDEQEGVGGCGEGLDGQIQRERQGVMSRGRREKTQQFSFPFFFFFKSLNFRGKHKTESGWRVRQSERERETHTHSHTEGCV